MSTNKQEEQEYERDLRRKKQEIFEGLCFATTARNEILSHVGALDSLEQKALEIAKRSLRIRDTKCN